MMSDCFGDSLYRLRDPFRSTTFQNLFGELSTACDFVDLVQNGFFAPPVVPLQGSLGHRSALRPLCLGYVSIRQTGSPTFNVHIVRE